VLLPTNKPSNSTERRAVHQSRERADRDAPRWAPLGVRGAAWWISDDNQLSGVLLNDGHVAAQVTGVVLDVSTGGRVLGRYRADPSPAADGVSSARWRCVAAAR
jgi:hypothetical protein